LKTTLDELPSAFSLFTSIGLEEQISQVRARLSLVTISIAISGLYILLVFALNATVLSDAWIILGFAFLFLRRPYIKDEIKELEQHLHGEGPPALD